MQWKKITGNCFIGVYLWVTICAFLLTILRIYILIPQSLVLYAYGMMAPYQSYGEKHQQLLVEGESSPGVWGKIDLTPYYPVLYGERNVREFGAVFPLEVPDERTEWLRTSYARKILELERRKGNHYSAIRLSWEQWPTMTGEFEANKIPVATEKFFVFEMKDE